MQDQKGKPITNLAIIRGNSAKVSKDGHISYDPSQIDSELNNLSTKVNIFDQVRLRSEDHFNNGQLEFTFKYQHHGTSIAVLLDYVEGQAVFCGYSLPKRKFVIAVIDGTNWKILDEAGKLDDYDLDTKIHFQITIKGSQIKLLINNIILCSANISIKDGPIELLIESAGPCEIHNIVKHDSDFKPSAFVVMQFSKEYNDLYEEVIKPVTEKFGYECVRADDKYASTPILNDIIQSIKDSSVVVAEITPDNPNVFYEIGYSHAIGKPTILLCDANRDKLPFDLSGFRTLFYENTIVGKKKVENSLMKYLERI